MGIVRHAPDRLIRRWSGCLAALCSLLVGVPAVGRADTPRVAIVFPEQGPYRMAADALAAKLRGAECDTKLFPVGELTEERRKAVLQEIRQYSPTVIAAAGATMTADVQAAFSKVPKAYFMVPNALDAPFARGGGALPGVSADVAPDTQIEWIKKTAPRRRNIAVLHGSRTLRTAAALRDAGGALGIRVTLIEARADKFADAIERLNAGGYDGVLMIPDSDVYDATNVQALLLWGLRGNRCVWTFSENVVKAGAFAGTSIDAGAVGEETAAVVQALAKGKGENPVRVRYAKKVRRAVNIHTAELIGEKLAEVEGDNTILRLGESK